MRHALEDAVGEQQSSANRLGRKYDFYYLAKADGTPRDHLAKILPAVLADVIESTFDKCHSTARDACQYFRTGEMTLTRSCRVPRSIGSS